MNMKLLVAVVTTPSTYHGCSTRKSFWKDNFTLGEFTPVNIKIVVVAMLGNTYISRIVRSTSPCTYR